METLDKYINVVAIHTNYIFYINLLCYRSSINLILDISLLNFVNKFVVDLKKF